MRHNLIISDALTGQKIWPQSSGALHISETGDGSDFSIDTNSPLPLGNTFPYYDTGRLYLDRGIYILSLETVESVRHIMIAQDPQNVDGFYRVSQTDVDIDVCIQLINDKYTNVGEWKVFSSDVSSTPEIPSGLFVTDMIGYEPWTLPYDAFQLCAPECSAPNTTPTVGGGPAQFMAYRVQTAPTPSGGFVVIPDYRFTGSVRIPTTYPAMTWSVPDLILRFPQGAILEASTPLTAVNTAFTATNTSQAWRGVTISGGTVVLDGSSVAGVSFAGLTFAQTASAVTVSGGGSLTMRNGASISGTINGQGVRAVGVHGTTGTPSRVTIEGGTTRIESNELAGVSADGGARVTIRDLAQVSENGAGVVASGYGSRVSLDHAHVLDNTGSGALATDGGDVRATSAAVSGLRTHVNGNDGGLSVDTGGSLRIGTCDGAGVCTNAGHQLLDNDDTGAFFDARSFGGSTLRAQGNDWGVQDAACLDTQKDASSTLRVTPIVPSGPACNPPSFGRTSAGTASARGMSDAVLTLVEAAEDALEESDEPGATAAMRLALALAGTDDDREGAFLGAARMLALADLGGVTAALDSATTTVSRPFSLYALAVGHASAGRASDADAVAATLVAEFAGGDLAAAALGIRTRLAVEAGDEAGALTHLAALADAAPESTVFTTAAALVAAVFPDAALPGGARTGEAIVAAKAGADAPAAMPLSVVPNPSSTAARVLVSGAGMLDMAVYDALGRRVAVLADGVPVESIFSADVNAAALPAGVYLVRAVVHGADGDVLVQVARLTVAR